MTADHLLKSVNYCTFYKECPSTFESRDWSSQTIGHEPCSAYKIEIIIVHADHVPGSPSLWINFV